MKRAGPEANRRLLEHQILSQLLEVKRIQNRLEGRFASLEFAPVEVRTSFLRRLAILEERVASLERLVDAWDQLSERPVRMLEVV